MRNFMPFILAIMTIIPCCKKEKKGLASVTTTSATNVTANSLSSGGTIENDGSQAITQRGICWATHTNPTVADSILNSGSATGSFNVTINGLNANTIYYIRAFATNASGTAYGNEVTATTAKGVPTVTTVVISDIQPLSAKSGDAISNDGGAAITERGVVFSTTTSPTLLNNKIVSGSGTGTFIAILSPLASQQIYYVRAYATNSFGTAYGNQVQFSAASANTVTDIDGNVYPYQTMCDGKNWMTTNLKTTKYKNGDTIKNGLSGFTWSTATGTPGAYTFPNGEASRKDSLGLLYNVFVLTDSRGVCPNGWHVPTDAEWQALEVCNGMDPVDANSNGERGSIGAKFLEGGSNGLNVKKAGFLFFNSSSSTYSGMANDGVGFLWSSTLSTISANSHFMRGFNSSNNPSVILRQATRSYANSIRCVKD